ncbi:hypothetical protein [Burkholderia multivorans]|uniref:hypothetical protein n=1 Tax=Burkholderia multivorans TaxID=87883 RepID=UPI001C25396D|nr:hypothetical protein [Burkholderia multivorans]MBU9597652.1 hypothetical protein [Burkholderia multivorans]MDN8000958.1 hypothetical protein [Burkholderia multivorans]WVN01605.1 hypothetical protein V1241_21580 [Burkholderia multivorans]
MTALLYAQTQQGAIHYRFNDAIEALEDDGDCVDVRFTGGERARFDALVGADGLHSVNGRAELTHLAV